MVLPFQGEPSNWIDVRDADERADVAALAAKIARMDEAAAVRVIARGGEIRLWARTPFGALATRLVVGTASAPDMVVLAGPFAAAARSAGEGSGGRIDLGYLVPSAWQGLLPPAEGFAEREMLRASDVLEVAERGRGIAESESGPGGIAPSLLDQVVISVDPVADPQSGRSVSPEHEAAAGVPMRMLFALAGAGFVPTRAGSAAPGERVRLSTCGPWVRLDARFGSVFWRPDESLPLSVS